MTTVSMGARPNKLAGWLVVAASLLVGCPEPVALPPSGCVPGASTACVCVGGGSGAQVCRADRTFGACQCGGDGGLDASTIDAPEAGATDAGTPETGTTDLGLDDVGAADVVAVDGGSPVDTGTADAVDVGATGTDVLPDGCAATTTGNCCGVACPAADHATAVCGGGTCTIACAAGYANCDGVVTNGCEAALASSDAHCGACGVACTMGQRCTGGTCQCPTGQALCGSRCVDVQRDAANCGACGAPCAAGRACVAGACTLCPTGQTVCPGACVDTQASAANCGSCGNACAAGQVCTGGACVTSCTIGFLERCSRGAAGPACCAGGRLCETLGTSSDTRCCDPVHSACTTTYSCCYGVPCTSGRCCQRPGGPSPNDETCCSGRRVAGICQG